MTKASLKTCLPNSPEENARIATSLIFSSTDGNTWLKPNKCLDTPTYTYSVQCIMNCTVHCNVHYLVYGGKKANAI